VTSVLSALTARIPHISHTRCHDISRMRIADILLHLSATMCHQPSSALLRLSSVCRGVRSASKAGLAMMKPDSASKAAGQTGKIQWQPDQYIHVLLRRRLSNAFRGGFYSVKRTGLASGLSLKTIKTWYRNHRTNVRLVNALKLRNRRLARLREKNHRMQSAIDTLYQHIRDHQSRSLCTMWPQGQAEKQIDILVS